MKIEELIERHQPPEPAVWPIEYGQFQRLFWKHKGLLKEQQRNSAFWNATNENLQRAYIRLDEQERELSRAYGLNREYLENIQEGLLIIDRDCVVLDQYSRYVVTLFRTEDITDRKLVDLIYQDPESQAEERKELERFLDALFTKLTASDTILEELNPLAEASLVVFDDDGGAHEIRVSTRLTRIIEEQEVTRVILTIEDRTEIALVQQALEEERDRHSSEIESISAMLKAGPQAFVDFVRESNEVIDELQGRLTGPTSSKDQRDLLRKLHSLKGSAKYLELDYLSALAHQIEGRLASLGETATIEQVEQLRADATRLKGQLDSTMELADRIRQFAEVGSISGEDRMSVPVFLDSLKRMTERIGTELGKSVEVTTATRIKSLPVLERVKVPLIHLVRNAVDHGIEEELERVAARKGTIGKIAIQVQQDGNLCVIEVSDDGRGIDFVQVEEKARSLGLLKDGVRPDQRRLLNLLFSPSFSSRDSASDISGRGFGLDVVRDAVSQLGGTISVATKEHRGTRFTLRIPEDGEPKT